jgi:phage baseplate assembly protein W
VRAWGPTGTGALAGFGGQVNKDFLGRGWSFPFRFDAASGAVSSSEHEENIRQCVTLVLGTRPGERQMLPEFGCAIHDLVFAPNTQATANLVTHHVRRALEKWEPRIELISVDSWPEGPGSLRVAVRYRIKATLTEQGVALLLSNGG